MAGTEAGNEFGGVFGGVVGESGGDNEKRGSEGADGELFAGTLKRC